MNKVVLSFATLSLMTCLNSCAVVGGIFKAGVWVGILAVVGIIALILFIVSRSSKK